MVKRVKTRKRNRNRKKRAATGRVAEHWQMAGNEKPKQGNGNKNVS